MIHSAMLKKTPPDVLTSQRRAQWQRDYRARDRRPRLAPQPKVQRAHRSWMGRPCSRGLAKWVLRRSYPSVMTRFIFPPTGSRWRIRVAWRC